MGVLKIALGVFIGIAGILIVRAVIDRARSSARARRLIQINRIIESENTPDAMIRNCGKPLKDAIEPSPLKGLRWRYMYYNGPTRDRRNRLVVFAYFDTLGDEKWQQLAQLLVDDLNGGEDIPRKIAQRQHLAGQITLEEKLMYLPCMAGGAKQ